MGLHTSNLTTKPRSLAVAISMLLAIIACVRIATTYNVFCQTYDEPAHIAAGMEWLCRGTYTFEDVHPPLARIAVAAGPFLGGLRLRANDMWAGGNQILYGDGRYLHNLALARAGIIPFFLLATFVVHAWARRLFGEAAAVTSVFVFTMLPPVLGHAGVATTDLPVAATCVAALYALVQWLNELTVRRSATLGFAVALAILSKFTALLFLPACGLAILGLRQYSGNRASGTPRPPSRRLKAICLAAIVACLSIWASYRFSTGTLISTSPPLHYTKLDALVGSSGRLHNLSHWAVETVPLPAPEFFRGVIDALQRDSVARGTYILGKIRQRRCWYFFLLVLAFKSPIASLILAGTGVLFLCRQFFTGSDWQSMAPGVAAAALLLVTLPVRTHAGIRHILMIYPLLSIVAGFGAVCLWRTMAGRVPARIAAALLLGWLAISSAAAHPDYLAYFNELAGGHPEWVLVGSDLDWGQDLLRLGNVLRARKVSNFALSYFGTADPGRHDLPPFTQLSPYTPTTGWVAISLSNLEGGKSEGLYSWLEAYKPVALVGRSIRLYLIPAQISEGMSRVDLNNLTEWRRLPTAARVRRRQSADRSRPAALLYPRGKGRFS